MVGIGLDFDEKRRSSKAEVDTPEPLLTPDLDLTTNPGKVGLPQDVVQATFQATLGRDVVHAARGKQSPMGRTPRLPRLSRSS